MLTGGKQTQLLDSITCNNSKHVFIAEPAEIICCEFLLLLICAKISDAGHIFLTSKEAENSVQFSKPAKLRAYSHYSDCDCDVTFPLMFTIAKCE